MYEVCPTMEETHQITLDVELHNVKENSWAQAKYLVHGHDDVLWTNSIDQAIGFIKQSLLEYENLRKK
ncbi:MAG: hypothetical protein U9N34_09985 [Candidatus Cloacimonadota bacterium]|nr:hypothetical protein [Candidatus Cloacimonadota bacterium]